MLLSGSACAQTGFMAAESTAGNADKEEAQETNTPATHTEIPLTADVPAPVTEPDAPVTAAAPIVSAHPTPEKTASMSTPKVRGNFEPDPDAYSVISSGKGLSLHKPMFLLPATYSEEYHGKDTEVLFQISLKQRLFGVPLYFAYTQKAFWQAYNKERSSPFRETDYNPELFYRFIPADRDRWFHLGADIGFEHESNGRDLPDSRSWNRVYIAPFQAEGQHLIYWKWWYRIPEDKSKPPTDPERDDNPDIQSYYGYSELHYEQQFAYKQLVHFMFRYNPVTGRGAVNLQYSIPNNQYDPSFFWMFYLFQGYGEDLLNYNHSVFRIGFGFALAR